MAHLSGRGPNRSPLFEALNVLAAFGAGPEGPQESLLYYAYFPRLHARMGRSNFLGEEERRRVEAIKSTSRRDFFLMEQPRPRKIRLNNPSKGVRQPPDVDTQ